MTAQEIDDYLAAVPEPQRSTLGVVRASLERLLPEAEQCISYGVPAFKVAGTGVAGFGAYRDHCTYVPMSGTVTTELADRLTGYQTTKGAVRFAADTPLPDDVIALLVSTRQAEIARKRG
jgi:uncharacterized protein YdhG (YjbR/CyaY superfamily)